MRITRMQPPGLPSSPAFSQVVRVGSTVYISGQVAQDERGQVVGRGDITAQATQVFENLRRALEAAGATFDDVVQTTVYLTDPRYRDAVRAVRTRYFTGGTPASTLLIVAGLAEPDYLLEIEAIADVG